MSEKKKFRLTEKSAPWLLLIFTLAAYIPLVTQMGFYWDDWPMLWFKVTRGAEGFATAFDSDRPFLGHLYKLTASLLSFDPLEWQIMTVLCRWAVTAAFWWMLRLLWPDRKREVFWICMLLTVFPGFKQMPIAYVWMNAFVMLLAYILSYGMMLKAAGSGSRKAWILWTIPSVLVYTFCTISTEYYTGLDISRGVILWIFFARQAGFRKLSFWKKVRKVFVRGCLYLFVIIMCIVILYPFVIMFTSAFRTDADANDVSYLHLFPVDWRWENFSHILNRGVLRFLLNSLLLSVGSTCLALLCGIPAAYALARMRFRGRKAFLGFVIMSQMFSPVVLLVGISRLLMDLNLNDTLPGLIFINAAFNQAFAIWLLRGTFVSISPEMEQAACIDGCNSVTALIRVLLPMAAPGIVTTLIFVFINAWNEYTISTVVIHSDGNFPITVGLTQFAAFSMIQWNYLFASSLLATIPVVILFMLIEKHLVSGLTSGGVKG